VRVKTSLRVNACLLCSIYNGFDCNGVAEDAEGSDQGSISPTDPESAKKTVKLSVFFALSGSVCGKASCRALIELTPGINFTNVGSHYFAPFSFTNTHYLTSKHN